jgi:hypothetical protein
MILAQYGSPKKVFSNQGVILEHALKEFQVDTDKNNKWVYSLTIAYGKFCPSAPNYHYSPLDYRQGDWGFFI